MNMFERATRVALRFETTVGLLSTEQLWALPLTSKGRTANLDNIAKGLARKIKDTEEFSFVEAKSENDSTLELSLDIVKYIIADKLSRREAAKKARETAARREKLIELLDKKQNQSMEQMTEEQILAELEGIGK